MSNSLISRCHCLFTARIRIQHAFCCFRTGRIVSELVLYYYTILGKKSNLCIKMDVVSVIVVALYSSSDSSEILEATFLTGDVGIIAAVLGHLDSYKK